MREITLYNNVEINCDTYRVQKLPAMEGACLYKFVAEKLLPTMNNIQTLAETPEGSPVDVSGQMIKSIGDFLRSIDNVELKSIMQTCLNYAYISLPAGWAKVMNGRDFGVDGLEYDAVTCIQICIQVIMWNFGDFFAESGLLSTLVSQNTSK